MVTTTVRNPANSAHFMHVKPVSQLVRVRHGERILAETENALCIMETGREPYDPVMYIPRGDVSQVLVPLPQKSTHCPLKGDASYFTLEGDEIAWSYDRPLESAALIRDHVAFYPDKVTIEQVGAHA